MTGNVLIAADAVMHSSMADAETRPFFVTDMDDERRIPQSTAKISALAKTEDVAFVVYGHDAAQ
ncbi:hypothetical protein AS026_18075 [Rhizobium altiplani]|uniref:MBL fold metallo-hydrolase n=1 Tax=Rhizobium altiplani TaxID=1864509 RepID=A0A109J8F5_9HYPH|nr:hypothetical protein AS026_18075 [Rhizobium altiplani]